MKRLLHILIPIVVLFGACTKEKSVEPGNDNPGTGGPGTGGPGTGGGSNTGYFMRCKLDNVSKNLGALVFATKLSAPGMTSYSVIGKLTAGSNNLEGLNLTINSNNALTTGTYSADYAGLDYIVGAVYNPNSQSIVYGTLGGDPGNNPLKIVITSISNTEIAGTFSGVLFEVSTTGPSGPAATHTITEGEFKAKFQ